MSLNNDVFNVLGKMNFNVNVELTIALRKNVFWKMFEVYNQAAKHGGRLIVRHLGQSFQYNDSKYIRRKNMTGVIFKSLIVVLVPH